jgi:hypothetical protein
MLLSSKDPRKSIRLHRKLKEKRICSRLEIEPIDFSLNKIKYKRHALELFMAK